MPLYKDYIEVNHDFIPVFNNEADKKVPTAWKSFIPHKSLKDIITHVIKSLQRESPSDCKPIWMSGSYGTGKTMASFVIKHLLEDDTKSVEDYFNNYQLLQPLYNQFRSLRESGDILVIHRSSSANIITSERLLIEVQQSVRIALENGRYKYLGGRTSYESILKRITDDNSTFNFKAAFDKHRLEFGEYSSYEQVINALQNIEATENYKLVETVARVMEKEGFSYFDNVDDIKDWLNDVINGNKLKAIVFIWDEFTDYFRQNRAVSTLQELAHASSEMPFYLFLITHRTVEQFSLDREARKVLEDRFKMIQFQMSEVTAYQLMANAVKIKQDVKDEWETKLLALWDRVEKCANKLKQYSDGLKVDDLQNLVPLHPFSAYLLSILSQHLSSNQRTMFQFLKEDAASEGEDLKHNFNWFIQTHSTDGWCWLTSDVMWDYFFKLDNNDLPEEVQRLINHYNSHFEELNDDEVRVFKCALLLIAMNRQLGAEKLLKPLQSNLALIFIGTPIYENLGKILDSLVEKGLLNFNHSGANDRAFIVPMMSYDKNKLDVLRRQIESQNSFEKCIREKGVIGERFLDAYKLTGPLSIRFVPRTVPVQNLKNYMSRLEKELEPYNIGIMFVLVKSEMDLAKVDDVIKENISQDSRIVLVNVNQAFGEKEWQNWLDAKTREAYAREMNNGPNARYFKDYADKIIDNWIEKVEISTMTGCFRGDNYNFSKLSGLNEYLEKISAQVYPNGPEAVTKNVTLYKLSGYSKQAVLMGMNHKKPQHPYVNIVDELKKLGFWENDNIFDLNPNHPVSMMKKTVDKFMEGRNSVYITEIWDSLMKNHGMAPSPVAAFLFGFLMKDYAGDGGYYRDDGLNAVPLSYEGLAEVIEIVMKQLRNYQNYSIVKMKPEHEYFCNIMQSAFDFTKEQASCPREVKQNIRRYLTEKKYPLWSLGGYLANDYGIINGKLKKIIDKLCEFISAQEESNELQIVEEVVEILKKNNSLIGPLTTELIDIENFKTGFKRYIQQESPKILTITDRIGITFNQIIDEIRNRMSEDAHWLWQENQLREVLDTIEDEYKLLDALNEFVNYKCTNLREAKSKVKVLLDNIRLPWSVIKNYVGTLKDTFELLIAFIYSDTDINKKDLATRLAEQSDKIRDVLDNMSDIFAEYILDTWSDMVISNEQVSEIYSKLQKSALDNDVEQFKQSIRNHLDNLKANLLMQDLVRQWQEISGVSSPKEWSKKTGIPILILPNITPVQYQETFKVINERNVQNYNQVENAINIIQQNKEAFAVLNNEELINEAFINWVAGNYAYLVKNEVDLDTIRCEIENHFGSDVYEWWLKQNEISNHIQKYLTNQYKQKTYKKVLNKIDDLSAEEAKAYLKQLIGQEPLVGIKILQSK